MVSQKKIFWNILMHKLQDKDNTLLTHFLGNLASLKLSAWKT